MSEIEPTHEQAIANVINVLGIAAVISDERRGA